MRTIAVALLLFAAIATAALAQGQRPAAAPQSRGAFPTADAPGLRDSAAVPRYAGSSLLGGSQSAFDEALLPNAPLVRAGDRRDGRLVYLIPEGRSPLEVMRGYQQALTAAGVLLVGHTDNQGAIDMNVDLSRRRAAALVQALGARGIPAGRMVGQGVGMAEPLATSDTDKGRARNRRVELVKQ